MTQHAQPFAWKGPFGRQWWENRAHDAWVDLGNPPPTPSGKSSQDARTPSQIQNDLHYDAFRHAYTHAIWVREFGEDMSRVAGDRVELDRNGNPPRDMRGDLINNEKGRDIGRDAPENATDRQIAERVLDAIKKGDLVLDKETDPGTLPENFPKDLNPIDKDWTDIPGDALDRFLDQLEKDIRDTLQDWSKDLTDFGDTISDFFDQARRWRPRSGDPLVLDLDGDGIETVAANGTVLFDHDGDGVKHGSGWVRGDDGFLVLDKNGNGRIDNGAELFGVDTIKTNGRKALDGFDALRDLDSNTDGVFDTNDTRFNDVRVWRDLNQDGVSQASELKTLAEHNIPATNPFYREYTDAIPLSAEVQALPDMKGSGAVHHLKKAA